MQLRFSGVYGQSIIDACMNTYGSLDNLCKFCEDNEVEVNGIVGSGQAFVYDDTLIDDESTSNHVRQNKIIYATAIEETTYNELTIRGRIFGLAFGLSFG